MGNPMETTDYIILIGNTIYTYIHLWESVEYVLRGDMQWAKLYIPSTLNIALIQWHTQLNVCAVK